MKLTVPPKRAVIFSAPTAILMDTKSQQENILHEASFDSNINGSPGPAVFAALGNYLVNLLISVT